MPSPGYAELSLHWYEMDRFETSDALWSSYYTPPNIDEVYNHTLYIAKRICTEKQYRVLFFVSRGLKHREVAEIFCVSRQNISEIYRRAVEKLKKNIKKHLPYGVIVEECAIPLEDIVREINKNVCEICRHEIEPGSDIVLDTKKRIIIHKECQNLKTAAVENNSNLMELTLG